MTGKPVVLRKQAHKDIEAAAEFYFEQGGPDLELRFIDALQAAVRRLSTHPAIGSARLGEALGIAGLRFWKLTRFPYLIFYVARKDDVDVWRVLHEQRDIPARFADDADPNA